MAKCLYKWNNNQFICMGCFQKALDVILTRINFSKKWISLKIFMDLTASVQVGWRLFQFVFKQLLEIH